MSYCSKQWEGLLETALKGEEKVEAKFIVLGPQPKLLDPGTLASCQVLPGSLATPPFLFPKMRDPS